MAGRATVGMLVLGWAMFSVVVGVRAADAGFTVNDIRYWIGTGSNQAVLVIDWNDGPGPRSLAWGYRWDGSATGEDMLTAIVNADPRLNWRVGAFSDYGLPLYGVGYDLNDDGILPTIRPETVGADTSGDHWADGWFTAGYWGYYIDDDGNNTAGDSWGFPDAGMSMRALCDGVWDGWSFAPGFSGDAPSEPVAAIPEPGTISLLALGAGAILLRLRRRR